MEERIASTTAVGCYVVHDVVRGLNPGPTLTAPTFVVGIVVLWIPTGGNRVTNDRKKSVARTDPGRVA